jgi:tetratricopeptide (TPR) repeat protein
LAAYNLIVPRVCKFLFLSALVGYPMMGAQTPAAPQQPPKQAEQQPPDETNPPEEDETVAPRKYVLNPLEAKRNIDVGNFYWKKGDYRGALDRYRDATHYNPSSAEAFLRVGEAEEKLHNADKAKAAFEKVIKLAPDSKFAGEAKKKLGSMKG